MLYRIGIQPALTTVQSFINFDLDPDPGFLLLLLKSKIVMHRTIKR